jgi:hypothetical protein
MECMYAELVDRADQYVSEQISALSAFQGLSALVQHAPFHASHRSLLCTPPTPPAAFHGVFAPSKESSPTISDVKFRLAMLLPLKPDGCCNPEAHQRSRRHRDQI